MFCLYTNTLPMRASTIHRKIMKASKKSNYNWIATPTALMTVCNKKNFPIKYSIDIKVAILNCYAILLSSERIGWSNSSGHMGWNEETDIDAVYFAYNSLFGIESESAINARKNFLYAFLEKICYDSFQFLLHKGISFNIICQKWKKRKLIELYPLEKLQFEEIKTLLENDFNNFIKEAEDTGILKKDDQVESEKQKRIIESSVNDFFETYGTFDNPKQKKLGSKWQLKN